MGSSNIKAQSHKNEEIVIKRQQFETEGWEDRTISLFHVTSSEAAQSIVDSGKMLRGKTGLFGGGIYFAETVEIANKKAHFTGATIKAEVFLGFSLICRKSDYDMNFNKLIKHYGCNSVKGMGCVSWPEYVVYNWSQVSIQKVLIGDKVYFKTKDKQGKKSSVCTSELCIYYMQKHIGSCRIKCINNKCEYYGDYHLGSCKVPCLNELCENYGENHRGKCKLKCKNLNCEDYGEYHHHKCRNKCKNERCENFGEYHSSSCSLK